MTKAQREKIERLKLKSMLDNNPKLKEVIDNMIETPSPEIMDVVEPEIERILNKTRIEGVLIGWQSFALRAIENIKDMKSVEEIKNYFQSEADKTRKQFGLKE